MDTALAVAETARPAPAAPSRFETATLKVRKAEDAWNSRNPGADSLAYTPDSKWQNRSEFIEGRDQIVGFLTRKWAVEHDYRLVKELWGFRKNRMAVRFCYEWHDSSGNWFRSYGNELWEFTPDGLMQARQASINDMQIREWDRKFLWIRGPRPGDHPGLSEMGL